MVLCILLSVAFFTLLEQKLLSYIQIRKGPNKVRIIGLIQPFCDAIKLFTKEISIPINSNFFIYIFTPIFSLFLSLFSWVVFPFIIKVLNFDLRFLFILRCISLSVYSLIISGWSSNSSYSLLGGLRSIAQTISYEVCIIFFIIIYFIIIFSLNFIKLYLFQKYFSFIFLNIIISFIILIIFLAETNRAPFDFAEGESELVSGFNTEYSSGSFALIFLAEYTRILFLSIVFVLLIFNYNFIYFIFFIKVSLIRFLFIWIRGAFPRLRYDKLIYLTWKIYLSFSLFYLLISLLILLVLFNFI